MQTARLPTTRSRRSPGLRLLQQQPLQTSMAARPMRAMLWASMSMMLTSGGGGVESSTSGHFTADVSLTATFGQLLADQTDTDSGTIAPGMLNTITGSISNFVLSGGEDNDWAVNLTDGVITPVGATFAGSAEGGGASGSFSGQFHGPTPLTPSTTDAADATVAPLHAVGEFNANLRNGTVAGAFGAERE